MKRTFRNVEDDSLKAYECQKEMIEELLAEIEAGLLVHDRNASSWPGGASWGHVGDLTGIADTLRDLRDRLHGTGEYAS